MNIYLDADSRNLFCNLVTRAVSSQCNLHDINHEGDKENSIFFSDFYVIDKILQNRLHVSQLKEFANWGTKFLLVGTNNHIDPNVMSRSLQILFKEYEVNPADIYVLLMTKLDLELLRLALADQPLPGLNVFDFNRWLTTAADIPITDQKPNKKFSVFSRRYDEWRLHIFFDLIRNDLLDESHFTFSDAHPDFDGAEDHDKMKSYVNTSDPYYTKISDWIDGIPYEIRDWDNTGTDAFSGKVQYMLESSQINICIENNLRYATLLGKGSNSDVLTEKTWKAILSRRPFLIIGPPRSLEHLRAEGFRSFSPFIHEEYDLIEDSDRRVESIVKELVRLNKLSKDDLDHLLEECMPIAEYNYQHMMQIANRPWPEAFKKLGIFT